MTISYDMIRITHPMNSGKTLYHPNKYIPIEATSEAAQRCLNHAYCVFGRPRYTRTISPLGGCTLLNYAQDKEEKWKGLSMMVLRRTNRSISLFRKGSMEVNEVYEWWPKAKQTVNEEHCNAALVLSGLGKSHKSRALLTSANICWRRFEFAFSHSSYIDRGILPWVDVANQLNMCISRIFRGWAHQC